VSLLYKEKLKELPKEKLIEMCNDLLCEMWNNGTFSNNYIMTMIKEAKKQSY
jgi:hypothetical protein